MRFDVWTIRVVPRPLSVTSIGVGVIVYDRLTARFKTHFCNVKSVFNSHDNVGAIERSLKVLMQHVEDHAIAQPSLEISESFHLPSRLSLLNQHWNNLIRVDQARVIDANNLDHATELAFEVFIGVEPVRETRTTVSQIRKRIRTAYTNDPVLSEITKIDPRVETSAYSFGLNVAVLNNEEVYELNQAFNITDQQSFERAEAWELKVARLREKGGQLLFNEEAVSINENVDVVAVLRNSPQSKNKEQFRVLTQRWEDLGIKLLKEADIESHADFLHRRIA